MRSIGCIIYLAILIPFCLLARDGGDVIWSYHASGGTWQHIRAIKSIADVDDDGYDDVIAVSENDTLYCLSGIDGDVIWRFVDNPCYLERGLISVPDLNEDGIRDVVIGTIWGTRRIFAISGVDGDTIWEYDTHEDGGGGWVYEVSTMDDITGDGIIEILAGAGLYACRAYLFNGATGDKIWDYYLGMNAAVFGVRAVGDLNDDDTSDVVVTTGDTDPGTSRVIALDGIDGDFIWDLELSYTGWTVVPIGDINTDGTPDIAVGTGGGSILGLSGLDGDTIWTRFLGSVAIQIVDLSILPDIDGSGFFELLPSGTGMYSFYCIDAQDGDIVWSTPVVDQVFTSNAVPDFTGDGLWDVVGGTGYTNCIFYAMDGDSGNVLWQKNVSSSVESSWWIEDIDANGYPDVLAGLRNGWIYALSDGNQPENAVCILSSEIGGDADYRSFWVNGSWDNEGEYDEMWSGPMVELKNDGLPPDSSALDDIFTGSVTLKIDSTHFYRWWTGSEDDIGSFLEDGDSFQFLSPETVIVPTLFIDPSGTGFNEWVICLAGDMNGWNNSADNLTRDGTLWSGVIELSEGNHEYKYTVMHSWNATYGYDPLNPGIAEIPGINIPFSASSDGNYRFFFDDEDNSYGIYWRKDAAILSIESPPDTLEEGSYIPQVTVMNLGWTVVDFDVICTIDGYTDTSLVVGLKPDSTLILDFDEWIVPGVGSYIMETCALLPEDEDLSNDTLRKTLYCVTGVSGDMSIPKVLMLFTPTPNPSKRTVIIEYGLPEETSVTIDIFSIAGTRIRRVYEGVKSPGFWSIEWNLTDDNGRNLPSGVYFCRVEAGDFIQMRKFSVLR